MSGKSILFGIIAFIVMVIFWDGGTIISTGEQGVVTRFGAIKENTLDPGFHWVTPIVNDVKVFKTRENKIEVEADAASKDLQSAKTRIALNYHLDPANVNKLFQEVGLEYEDKIIQPAMQESIKASTAMFSASELITQRTEVKNKMMDAIKARLSTRYIVVDDVAIVNFTFSEAFDKSIEAKQVAEQSAMKAKQDLERVKLEAEQRVAQAEAEARSLKAQKEQITPELLELRRIEMQAKALEKWNGVLPTQMIPGATVPFINIK